MKQNSLKSYRDSYNGLKCPDFLSSNMFVSRAYKYILSLMNSEDLSRLVRVNVSTS